MAQVVWLDTRYRLHLVDEAAPFHGSEEEQQNFVHRWEGPLAQAKHTAPMTAARRRYKKLVDMV